MKFDVDVVLNKINGEPLKEKGDGYLRLLEAVAELSKDIHSGNSVLLEKKWGLNEKGAKEMLIEHIKEAKEFDVDLTLKNTCISVLEASLEKDKNLSADKKFGLHKMAEKIYEGGEVELTAEEVTTLKSRIGTCCSISVLGASFKILEQVKKKEEESEE